MTTLQDFANSLPDLRNGQANDYEVVHVATGIAEMWHVLSPNIRFPGIANVREAFRVRAAIYAARLQANAIPQDKARAKGCVLAAARLGLENQWQIVAADIIPAQVVAEAGVPWNAAGVGADRITDVVARDHYDAIDGGYISDDIIWKLMKAGAGILATSGVILVKTNGTHHFVAPHKGCSTCVLRQIMGKGYTPPFTLTQEEFEDTLCHKVPHCYTNALQMTIAREHGNVPRLRAAGLSTAAVRIPAPYAPEAGASAVRALVVKAAACSAIANVAIGVDAINARLDTIVVAGVGTPVTISAAEEAFAHILEEEKYSIAKCCGLVRAAAAHAAIDVPDIFKSWCLKRIEKDNDMEVVQGSQQMDAAIRAHRERSRRGIVNGMGLFGATAPPDTEPMPADETLAQILAAVMGAQNTAEAGN